MPQQPENPDRVLRDVLDRPLSGELRFGPESGEPFDGDRSLSTGGSDAGIDGDLALILLLALAVAAVVILVVAAARSRRGPATRADARDRRGRPNPRREAGPASAAAPPTGVAAAREAARAGDHAGALHTLLLTAIERFEASIGRRVPARTTTRDLVRGARGVPPLRDPAFGVLAGIAERARFSGLGAHEADWQAGLEAFERLDLRADVPAGAAAR